MWTKWRVNCEIHKILNDQVKNAVLDAREGAATKQGGTLGSFLDIGIARTLKEEAGGTPIDMASLMANLKILLFAGHDTTSVAMCWMFKLLQDNPACLARLRSEHDEILGPDPCHAARILRDSPQVLNNLTYTQAVIKETLRLHVIAFTGREGETGFSLSAPGSNTAYPTEGMEVQDVTPVIHRDPAVWPRADEFVPERWLAAQGDPLYPTKDAWRAFSTGSRSCIGMELAMMELKLVAALVCREFDIAEAWEKWDAKQGLTGKKDMYNGERLYACGQTMNHLKDGMPVHVKMSSKQLEINDQ